MVELIIRNEIKKGSEEHKVCFIDEILIRKLLKLLLLIMLIYLKKKKI